MDESEIQLGERYRDTISGFEGTAIGRHEYIHGCTRITLESLLNGKPEQWTVDAPALERVEDRELVTSGRTGGPRPAPPLRPIG